MLTDGMSIDTLAVLKTKLLCDFGFFIRFFFKARKGKNFLYAPHVQEIVSTLNKVVSGEITRLIINMPPRYGKTETAVKMFMAWAIANNPRARFMHLSYSDDLVKSNSDETRDIIKSPEFRFIFDDISISKKTDAKGEWYTEQGGGVYAVSTGSPITGFGAGIMGERQYKGTGSPADGFGGAIIIDDPLKTEDAISETVRERVNGSMNRTIMSRVNSEDTPVIVIMQRLHAHDMSGFLLDGGTGDKWHNLVLSAIKPDGTPLFPEKHSLEDLEKKRAADPDTFAAQYMQSPVVETGNIFKREWFNEYIDAELPVYFDEVFQSWDFTFKETSSSDFVAGQVWGIRGSKYYLLDLVNERMNFTRQIEVMLAISAKWPQAVAKYVEAKANGEAIIDVLSDKLHGIIPVMPKESKVARAHAVTPLFIAGNVWIPKNAPWKERYIQQLTMFPRDEHDDMVDATTQGLSQTMVQSGIWNDL